jgi:hypothetical protein
MESNTNETAAAYADRIAARLHRHIWGGRPEGRTAGVVLSGRAYVTTEGTGEVFADCCFLYPGDAVETYLDGYTPTEDEAAYADFCQSVAPVEDERLARELLAAEELRACSAGLCQPILFAR